MVYSGAGDKEIKRFTVRDARARKGANAQPLVCLTSYTAPMTHIIDRHADMILVGDSLGMVVYGLASTLPVTLEMMISHGGAVVRSSRRALVIVDMPFGSYQESPEQAFRNAARIMSETGCGAVKLEGGEEMAATVAFLTQRGIPVAGHTGLQPQSVNTAGGYRVTGRNQDEAKKILSGAQALARAGAFCVVLECIDSALADLITKSIDVPTIGIGASAGCDGQVIVTDDMLGLTPGPHPRFVSLYADLGAVIDRSLEKFSADVRARAFPQEKNLYRVSEPLKSRSAK